MAIPNLAPGYLNQVKAAQDRAELERERMRFEDEQRRKALQERVGMEFLGTALGIGGKAAVDAATEAIRKPRVEAERNLREYQTDAPLAAETGADLARYTYDQSKAAEGLAAVRPQLQRRGATEAPVARRRTEVVPSPARDPMRMRGPEMRAPVKLEPAMEAELRRAALTPSKTGGDVSEFMGPPAELKTPSAKPVAPARSTGAAQGAPGPVLDPLAAATPSPRRAMRQAVRPAMKFETDRDRKLYELGQAARDRLSARDAETARKAQLELRKQRQAEYKDRLARTDKFREWAATRNDATYNNQNVLDPIQDASNRLAQGQFERGTIVVSMREWIRSQPTPELQQRAYDALPTAMQAQYDLGYTEMLERDVTADELKRYSELFKQARKDKGKKGRTTGSTGPRFSLMAGAPEVPLIDIPRGKGGSSERINLLDPKTLGFLYEDAPKFIQSGGQQDFKKGIGSMRRVLREVKRAKKWTPKLVGEYEKLASNAAKALNANKSSVAAFIEQFGALKKAGATAEKAEKEAKKEAAAQAKTLGATAKALAGLVGDHQKSMRALRGSVAKSTLKQIEGSIKGFKNANLTADDLMSEKPFAEFSKVARRYIKNPDRLKSFRAQYKKNLRAKQADEKKAFKENQKTINAFKAYERAGGKKSLDDALKGQPLTFRGRQREELRQERNADINRQLAEGFNAINEDLVAGRITEASARRRFNALGARLGVTA